MNNRYPPIHISDSRPGPHNLCHPVQMSDERRVAPILESVRALLVPLREMQMGKRRRCGFWGGRVRYPSTAPRATTPALKLKVVSSQRISLDLLFGREQGISRIGAVINFCLFAAARQGLARNDIFSRKSFELDQSVLAAQRMAMCVLHQSPVVKRHASTATILDICIDETNTRKPS